MSAWLLLLLLPACEPIQGVQELLGSGKVLLLGELHGTVESPAFTADVACHAAAAGLEVVVALELPSSAKLVSSPLWQRSYQDGRTSRAMADLLDELARLCRDGGSVRVVLFDAQPAGGSQARERAMAANLAASFEASPDAMHIVLTGNAHSRVTKGGRQGMSYEPMGFLLARLIGAQRLTSLNVSHAGGSAWICGPDCGVVRVGGRGSERRWSIEIDEATRPAGHHGWYDVGTITASPPAVGGDDVALPEADQTPAPPPGEPGSGFPPQTEQMLRPFQGSWKAYQYGSVAWTLDVDKQRFRGVLGPDDWYEGRIRLHPGKKPAQIDFTIEDCRCSYRGMTSQGIFRMDGESIILAAPQPGSPRPTAFNPNDGKMVELRRAEANKDD